MLTNIVESLAIRVQPYESGQLVQTCMVALNVTWFMEQIGGLREDGLF